MRSWLMSARATLVAESAPVFVILDHENDTVGRATEHDSAALVDRFHRELGAMDRRYARSVLGYTVQEREKSESNLFLLGRPLTAGGPQSRAQTDDQLKKAVLQATWAATFCFVSRPATTPQPISSRLLVVATG